MHSKRLLITTIMALLLALIPISQAADRPNIILFLVDDMGWMDSQPYGSQYYDTPNMQRLADQGMRFTSAYAMPLCSPTRASILTGQHTSRHGILAPTCHSPPQEEGHNFLPEKAKPSEPLVFPESRNYLDTKHYTLAEALRDAGYRTGHIGKWHIGLTEPHWPDQHGFEMSFFCPDPGPPNSNYFSPYYCIPPGAVEPERPEGERFTYGTITDGPPGEYITDRLTDESLKFISENRDRPFFLNLWHFAAHGPWGHKEEITAEMAKRTDPTGRQDNPVMASMLKSVDESLGRILDKVDELGLADDTLILFTSDNGGNIGADPMRQLAKRADLLDTGASYKKWAGTKAPTNNAPLKGGKASIHEGGIRVPLIVSWPEKIAAGTTSDEVVGCIDFFPTLLELTGTPPNPDQVIDGVSIAPVLLGTGDLARTDYFTWHSNRFASVRQGDWKLIRTVGAGEDGELLESHQLYNLKEDLSETTNLVRENQAKVEELSARIDHYVKETGSLYPKLNPAYRPKKDVGSVPGEPDSSLWRHIGSASELGDLRNMTASFFEPGPSRVLKVKAETSMEQRNLAWLDIPAPAAGWNLDNVQNVEATIQNTGSGKVEVFLWAVAQQGWTAVGEAIELPKGETATIRCDLRKTYRDGSPIIDPGKVQRIRLMTKGAATASLEVTDLIASGKANDWTRPAGRVEIPDMTEGAPAPGKRVRYQLPADAENDIYCALYLPTDWEPGRRYPVIAELPGNIAFNPRCWSTGRPEQCEIGYGVSSGENAIWVSLPFVDRETGQIAEHGFGSREGADTGAYVQEVIADLCKNWGGDPDNLILSGFSRGAIACGYIGLANDDIASLWKGIIACQHYDGSRWQQSRMEDAIERAGRFRGKAIFQVDNEKHKANFRQLMAHTDPAVEWTWVSSGLGNHATAMFLDDRPSTKQLREWFHDLTVE